MKSTNTNTPGPWTTSQCTPETSEGASYALTIVVETEERHIAFVFNDNPADARLIAAAPDLLEAVKLAKSILSPSGHTEIERANAIRVCNLAIMKAVDGNSVHSA